MSRKDLLPAAGPVLNTRQALYRATRDAVGGQNCIALTIGIDPDELSKRLNPTNHRPIHPELIEEIVAATRDPRLLAALVRPAGAVVFVPRPVEATRSALKALGELLKAEGEFVGSLHAGAADSRRSRRKGNAQRYFAAEIDGTQGIWERRSTAWGDAVRPVFVFTSGAPGYRVAFPFFKIAENMVKAHYGNELRDALDHAVRTAR